MKFEVEVKMMLQLSQQDVDDIMSSALDGGITYWCDSAVVVGGEYLGDYASDQISRGGKLRLHDAEEDEWHVLTQERFLNGFKRWAEEGLDNYGAIKSNGSVDTCEIDADVADCIIQLALFDEVVYG